MLTPQETHPCSIGAVCRRVASARAGQNPACRSNGDRYARGVTEPRRVLIDWDYGAHGIWWVLTKEEKEAPTPRGGHRTDTRPPGWDERPRPWSDRLTSELLDDLQAWNDNWDNEDADPGTLQVQGRELAIRVQDELGTDGWEVLYKQEGRVYRVHPPGYWPAESWPQELLGYRPRDQERASRPCSRNCTD
jgi:hypothetical protein